MDKDDKPRIRSRIHMHVRRTNKIGRKNSMLIVVVYVSFFWGEGSYRFVVSQKNLEHITGRHGVVSSRDEYFDRSMLN